MSRIGLALAFVSFGCSASPPLLTQPVAPPPAPQKVQVDLTRPFHTRSAWRLVVTQGPAVKDVVGEDEPGALTLCLHRGPAGPCLSEPVSRPTTPEDRFAWEPHYLRSAKVVYPRGLRSAPFLLIVTGSLYSGDGDEIVSTLLLTYDRHRDAFRRIYARSTGHNNNQEIRFITAGPLRGSVITAEPQQRLPYGYWITVDRLTDGNVYQQVLRYRSATLYNDGNPLTVIDSEMPNIEERLGLWKPGEAIPAPVREGSGKPCLKPTLRHSELWCGAAVQN